MSKVHKGKGMDQYALVYRLVCFDWSRIKAYFHFARIQCVLDSDYSEISRPFCCGLSQILTKLGRLAISLISEF